METWDCLVLVFENLFEFNVYVFFVFFFKKKKLENKMSSIYFSYSFCFLELKIVFKKGKQVSPYVSIH